MPRRTLLALCAGALACVLATAAATAHATTTPAAAATWVEGWAAAPQSSAKATDTVSFSNQTLRLIVHLHTSGSMVRVRLANTFGDRAETLNRVTVAVRTTGAAVKSLHTATFGGQSSATVTMGAEVSSDLLHLPVVLSGPAGASPYSASYVRRVLMRLHKHLVPFDRSLPA